MLISSPLLTGRRLCRAAGWALALLLAGSAAGAEPEAPVPAPEQDLVFPAEIEALLNETSDAEGYGALERCISVRSIRRTEVLDDRHIVFELPSKRFYLVQFKYRCQRLRPGSAFIYEPRGSQLCHMDYVRAVDNLSRGDIGPPCSIPGFYAVTAEQVSLLRETLKARRKAEVDAAKAEKARKKQEKADAAAAEPDR